MKSDEIIEAVEAEVEKAESVVKRWLKAARNWLLALSFKTKATIVVSIAILSGLMFTLVSASHAPAYVSRSEAYQMLAQRDAKIADLSKRLNGMNSDLHQIRIELNAVEAKLTAPAKITTGSIKKSKKRR